MKKRVVGLLGLILVIIVTFFAIILPDSGVSATSSFSDGLVVRVVGVVPNVDITGISNREVFITDMPSFNVSYENVETVQVILKYTDQDGNVKTMILDERTPDYNAGSETFNIRFVK
ncbi:MAG: hypothetical protein Q4A79_01805 [Candidatus Saccharibacteria bacterium]|nr:hypothetical protein [Candidatus Saccharibacteria bacterium]